MQEHLQFIEEFANTIANTFKQFAHIARHHLKKANEHRPEFTEIQNQLIQERKKRMELEDIIRQRVSGVRETGQSEQQPINTQQRKRPKTAFLLFVADQRQKILRQHPTLDLYKITSLAAIKWKKLNKQQQQVYQKKLQEMNKISDEQIKNLKQKQGHIDGFYVKKQFGTEQEEGQNQQAHQKGKEDEDLHPHQEQHQYSSEQRKRDQNNQFQQNRNPEGQQQPDHEERQQELLPTLTIDNYHQNQHTQQLEDHQEIQNNPIETFGELFQTQKQENFYVSEEQKVQEDPSGVMAIVCESLVEVVGSQQVLPGEKGQQLGERDIIFFHRI